MIYDCFGEHYKSLEKKIRQNFHLATQYFDVEGIHDMRVEIKRLRAFFNLIGHVNPVFKPKQNLKSIRRLFKSAGPARDIHVQQDLSRTVSSEGNLELSEFYNFLKEKEGNAREQFDRASKKFDFGVFKTNWTEMRHVLIYISAEYIQYKSEERLNSLIEELFQFREKQKLVQEDHHAIRILSKETRYTLEIIQTCFPQKGTMDKLNGALRSVHQALGKWHDYDIGLLFLEEFRKESAGISLFCADSYVQYENKLREQKEEMLKEFETRWTALSGIVSMDLEAEC